MEVVVFLVPGLALLWFAWQIATEGNWRGALIALGTFVAAAVFFLHSSS
jgi:hypothetical protein